MTLIDKAIVFDISSDFAMFRRGYTTTSSLSYPFPPKTTIMGIIAAILGKDYDNYYEKLKSTTIGIRMLSTVRKIYVVENYINTKNYKERTQVSLEYLRYPKYRIYVHTADKDYEPLASMLNNHETYYTPYLGTAKCLATIDNVRETSIEEHSVSSPVVMASIVPLEDNSADSVVFEQGKRYGIETVPWEMTSDRVVSTYRKVIYEETGGTITIRSGKYYTLRLGETTENVILL